MDRLLSNLKISVPEKIFIKDPESSKLGKKIIEHSILLINDIGFNSLTFKKLGIAINSNESSIYRYFENKHKLLVYLTSWYWGWMEYQIVFETHFMTDSSEKLKKAIEILTRKTQQDSNFSHINEIILNRIIINENSKSYLTTQVDNENKEGHFEAYKNVVHRLKDIINTYNPTYKFATSLSSTIIEGSLHQHFLNEHFPSLTDCKKQNITPTNFYTELTFNTLK